MDSQQNNIEEYVRGLIPAPTRVEEKEEKKPNIPTSRAIISVLRPDEFVHIYNMHSEMITQRMKRLKEIGWEEAGYLIKARSSPLYCHKLLFESLLAMDVSITLAQPKKLRRGWRTRLLSEDAMEDVEVALIELSELLLRTQMDDCEKWNPDT